MAEFDITYLRRADQLIQDAKSKAASPWKFSPAASAYFNRESLARIFGTAASSVVVGTVAQACAGAVLAAGVATASVATFGIGPAVGVVLTYGFLKGLMEFKYQSKNDTLKKGIVEQNDNDGDGSYFAITDPSHLCPLIAKVLKKYERVQRAAAQAGAYGTWAHLKSSARHAKTAARGFLKDHGAATTQRTLFPNLGYSDHELSDRLYELQFYGQMLFNYVERITDTVVVPKRNEVADACQLIYPHVVRQVHVTGNHHHCGNCCYNMSPSDFYRRFYTAAHDGFTNNVDYANLDDMRFLRELRADVHLTPGKLEKGLQALQRQAPAPSPEGGRKGVCNDTIREVMFNGAVLSKEVMGGVQFINEEFGDAINKGLHKAVVPNAMVAGDAAQAAASGAQSAGQTAGLGVVVAELARTISNRLTKRSVLMPGRLHGAFNLLKEGDHARAAAFKEFQNLIANHDVTSRAPRVGEKIVWYIEKLTKIQEKFNKYFEPALRNDYRASVFASCHDAYKLVYNANYFFKNCEKLIAFLVYLEVLLLEIDQMVSQVPGIGLGRGAIITPGRKTPPKPITVKGFGADWDKEKSVLPWK
jgi:hypothetical protein